MESRTRSGFGWTAAWWVALVALLVSAAWAAALGAGSPARAASVAGATDLEFAQSLRANCQLQLRWATTDAERTRARQCVTVQGKVIAGLSAPPTTPPTPSPTVTASPVPTVSPTVTPPPPPPPTGERPLNCVRAADLCGYPTYSTTGPPAGLALTVISGNLVMSVPDKVYDALEVRGCVIVGAHGVRLTRSIVRPRACGPYVVDNDDRPWTRVQVSDTWIDMSGMPDRFNSMGWSGGNAILTRVRWTGGADCAHFNGNIVIQDSYCEIPRWIAEPGGVADPHMDGFHSSGGDGALFLHNTVYNRNDSTSAMIVGGDLRYYSTPTTNVRVIDNFLWGGGYTIYCDAHRDQTPAYSPVVELRDNRFSRALFSRGGQYGATTDCTGVDGYGSNYWDEDGAALPSSETPRG